VVIPLSLSFDPLSLIPPSLEVAHCFPGTAFGVVNYCVSQKWTYILRPVSHGEAREGMSREGSGREREEREMWKGEGGEEGGGRREERREEGGGRREGRTISEHIERVGLALLTIYQGYPHRFDLITVRRRKEGRREGEWRNGVGEKGEG
jgi:hypothetical protein